ncbi:tRNA (adenine(37)-N6)-methyltransferase [Thalictrum thalictroides]|uniref:tRNA (Adenine(37)-N6)-methyltransferase n=1 Tax=Thalictrum thalictroides TaxID=46969 RepID=A0A7J6VBN1_THATH|nr:tRNA (adenine(37)-N6)-methyltransferase [Thalictrum thalictroides]
MAMTNSDTSKWLRATIALAVAAISTTAAISVYICTKKSKHLDSKIEELEISLKASLQKCAAERKGRIKAQQVARKALTQNSTEKSKKTSYPMTPIGAIQSCFATRYGTPRQPLLVPLARACLVFDTSLVPPAALEGLLEYSHCWIIYVFHLNTDLEKLWKPPSNSKFKAKVRVPKLKGGRMGVFATRSPHRPCPIGLTCAKVEAVQGHMVLLSGVDLVDGTPVLDIKPYLPYCESIEGATVPNWVKEDNSLAVASVHFSPEFFSSLANCWVTAEGNSLYASPDELKILIKQVLSWDIRSLSQRIRPHSVLLKTGNDSEGHTFSDVEDDEVEVFSHENGQGPLTSTGDVIYHLMLEDLDISYKIDVDGNVIVEKAILCPAAQRRQQRSSYTMWREMLE